MLFCCLGKMKINWIKISDNGEAGFDVLLNLKCEKCQNEVILNLPAFSTVEILD